MEFLRGIDKLLQSEGLRCLFVSGATNKRMHAEPGRRIGGELRVGKCCQVCLTNCGNFSGNLVLRLKRSLVSATEMNFAYNVRTE